MHLQRASELTSQAISWVWPGRLAAGKLAMLDGDPGLGKSLLTLDLAARLSTGYPMPDGQPGSGPGNVLILEAEDGQQDTVRPRLQALGADLERVFLVQRGALGELPRLPSQLAALEAALVESAARLLIVDPVVAFLDAGVMTSSDPSVRRALLPLAQLAERRGCAVLLVRHLNKQANKRALYRGGGSIGLLGACRAGWLVAEDPQTPGRRVLAQVKNNLAPPQPSLAFEVRPRAGAPPALAWLGDSPRTADELVGLAGPAEPSPREQAKTFLAAFLRDGPRTTKAIWEAAQRQGLTKRTLRRARQELEVQCEWTYLEDRPRCYWLLPGQTVPLPPELERFLRPILEQSTPGDPLEQDG